MTIFLPCLLERWRGDGKSLRTRPALNTWEDVRRDMIRNLEWLLNTEAPLSLAKDAAGKSCFIPEAVANSVLCFGIALFRAAAVEYET
jgi:predicted component of type VI protein secretion system